MSLKLIIFTGSFGGLLISSKFFKFSLIKETIGDEGFPSSVDAELKISNESWNLEVYDEKLANSSF